MCKIWIRKACTSERHISKSPLNAPPMCCQTHTAHGVISGEVLTSIVVTTSVLLAKVSDVLMSKDVEFIANVLLEYQTPICMWSKKKLINNASL